MKKAIQVAAVEPGMILAEDIYIDDKLLLAAGSAIKSNYIGRLIRYDISQVFVYAQQELPKVTISSNPVQSFYDNTTKLIGQILEQVHTDEKIDLPRVTDLVKNIIGTVFVNQDSVLLLTGYKNTADIYDSSHSLDVCLYSLITAKALGLSYQECVTLAMGALLSDVGKTKVPGHIMHKQGSLTVQEFEEVKQHALYGYQILKKNPEINPQVARIVLEHHERCNGGGYPNHLRSDEIFYLSKIVAIADIYDALTSDRIFKAKILPHQAGEYLLSVSNTLLDRELTQVFLKNVAIYPKGCQVLLNTNEIAVVVDSNLSSPFRPRLQIVTDSQRNQLSEPYELPLESNHSAVITHIFN